MCKCFYKGQDKVVLVLQWSRTVYEINPCDNNCINNFIFIIKTKSKTINNNWSVVKYDISLESQTNTLCHFDTIKEAIIFAYNLKFD